ncbi:MAG: sodium:alanine symporter family protein [Balneolales bacterium]|nr:sodium:alanine symporter family protein [Balneolales bacterium]
MEILELIVDTLENLVWDTPSVFPMMVVLLLGFGIFITIRLGAIQLRKLKHGIKVVMGVYDDPNDEGDVNHFQALSTALSATVGIGNIAGVALAIHFGGPGALVWMWVTAVLGMAIKYAECTLAVHYRQKNKDGSVSGGPMYYIEKGLGKNWKWMAMAFAGFTVICSFFTGNAIQANTVADVMSSGFSIPVYVTGAITASIVGIVILGGIKRIGYVTSRLTPLMAVLYVLGALVILLLNYDQILPSLYLIVSSAFNPVAGAYGVGSGVIMTTLVWGVKRGLFSNEAGQGSAPIAHAAAKTDEPVREGVVALLEPFIDTLIVCTMTGLVIITTGVWDTKHAESISLSEGNTSYGFVQDRADISAPLPEIIFFENGLPASDVIVQRFRFSVDTLFVDPAQTMPFTGEINLNTFTAVTAEGQEFQRLFGNAIDNGASLTARAFQIGLEPIMPFGAFLVTICVLLFAISTSISWSYYGDRGAQYLFGDGAILPFRIFYVFMHFVGAVIALELVWRMGDIALGLMTIPNLIALFALSGVVVSLTNTYFKKLHTEED